jgi:hypothetical protein
VTWQVPRPAHVATAVALGLAATAYGVRSLAGFQRAGVEPGIWDLVVAVLTDPRFTTIVLLTAVLVRMSVQRDRVVPELVRIGTNRRILLTEVIGATRTMLLPLLAILVACFLTAAVAKLPPYTLILRGSAAGELAASGISPPVGIGLQTLLVGTTLLVVQTVLASIRIVSRSLIPVVAVALAVWAWGGVSVFQLQTVINNPANGASIAESLPADAAATLNSGAYLDILIAISGGVVPFVIATLALASALSFMAVWMVDLRIVRSRNKSLLTSSGDNTRRMTIAPYRQSS